MKTYSRLVAAGLIAASTLTPLLPAAAQSLPGGAPDVISLLETEHKAALRLLDQILSATDGDQRSKLLHQLADALTIHNANEENIVYPAIRDAAKKPDDAMTLYHQQDESKVVIAQLMMLPKDGAAFTDLTKKLQSALMAHIHQEESVDFPAVRAALGSNLAQLNTATAQLRAHWNSNPTA